MGGKAIKAHNEARTKAVGSWSKERKEVFEKELKNALTESFFVEGEDFFFPNEFSDKHDFGDIDLFVNDRVRAHVVLITRFPEVKSNPVKNGPVWSFAVELEEGILFQLDLVQIKNNNTKLSKILYNNGDFGGYVGMVARQNGMRFGQDGLFSVHKDQSGEQQEEVRFLLTDDAVEMCDILRLDIKKILAGFETKKDMLRYFCEWEMSWDTCLSDRNSNSKEKHRNKNRPDWKEAREFVEQNCPRQKGLAPSIDPVYKALLDKKAETIFEMRRLKRETRKQVVSYWKDVAGYEGIELGRKVSKEMEGF